MVLIQGQYFDTSDRSFIELTYKQLTIRREQEQNLYRIVAPEGYGIVAELDGNWTALTILKNAVDHFLSLPGNSIDTILIELNPTKQRGRPSKKPKKKLAELLPEAEKEEEHAIFASHFGKEEGKAVLK